MFWRLAIPVGNFEKTKVPTGHAFAFTLQGLTSLSPEAKIEHLVLATSYFRPEGLSSPLQGLTSLFGMGRGVTLALNHQH